MIDVRAVFQQDHRELAIEAMPSLLLPRKGRYGLLDYEKMFCPDLKSGNDIFDDARHRSRPGLHGRRAPGPVCRPRLAARWLRGSLRPSSTASCCGRIERPEAACATLSVTPHGQLPKNPAHFCPQIQCPRERPASIELSAPLRYTGCELRPRKLGPPRRRAPPPQAVPDYLQYIKGLMMSTTFDQVANIIAETCDIPRDRSRRTATPSTISGSTAWISSISRSPSTRRSGSSCRSSNGRRRSTTARRRPGSISCSKISRDRIDELVAAKMQRRAANRPPCALNISR